MPQVLIDNDVVAKCAIYSLLDEAVDVLNVAHEDIGILGVIRFVISPKKLFRASDGADRAHERLLNLISTVTLLEPTEEETKLATQLEDAAQNANVQLDIGESQLCAIMIFREAKQLYTGDKRAIQAIEQLRKIVHQLLKLDQKVVCLEGLFTLLNKKYGHLHIRNRVCRSTETDTAIEICYQCSTSSIDTNEIDAGIKSYVTTLHKLAPNVLAKS